MIGAKRLGCGYYLLDNGFEIVRDDHSFSRTFWIVCHSEDSVFEDYKAHGHIYCFQTLREARMYMLGLTVDNMHKL